MRGCLESALSLRGNVSTEIIAIDDASTDGTGKTLRQFSDPRLRVIIHERNQGAIATANEGYSLARGKYVARLDSDDCYRPSFLEKAVPVLEREPRMGMVYGDIATIDTQGHVTAKGNMVRRNGRPVHGNEFFALLEENFVPAPTTLMRREALQPLLPVPAELKFLDWYLTTGIAESWDSFYVAEVLADYRIHTTNMHRTMIRDRTGEATSFRILDALFRSPVRHEEKRCWRNRIYACNYLVYADKYFGYGMNADARRCYLSAIRYRPSYLLRGDIFRRLAATLTSRRMYESAKRLLHLEGN